MPCCRFTYPCKSGSSVTFGPRAVKFPLLTSWTNFWPKCAKPQRLRFPLGEPRRRLGAIKRTLTFFLTLDDPTLPFDFEIGKIVKHAPQFRSAQFNPREKPRAPAPHRPPRKPWTSRKSDCEKSDAYRRLVPTKWIGVDEISAGEIRTPRNN